MQVLTDDNVLIGGFIVTGLPQESDVRAIGPSSPPSACGRWPIRRSI